MEASPRGPNHPRNKTVAALPYHRQAQDGIQRVDEVEAWEVQGHNQTK